MRRAKESNVRNFCSPSGECREQRQTCADGIEGESAGEESICDFLLLPVEDDIRPNEGQGVDGRDPSSLGGWSSRYDLDM